MAMALQVAVSRMLIQQVVNDAQPLTIHRAVSVHLAEVF